MTVEYIKYIISNDNDIQKYAVIIGKLENKAIVKLIDRNGITKILETFLSKKELDRYYRTKLKLKELLNK